MQAACYSLDLYCDNEDEDPRQNPNGKHGYDAFPYQYTGETGGECRKAARKEGWILNKDGKDFCPRCSGKKKVVKSL
jgi:hypothetical protein